MAGTESALSKETIQKVLGLPPNSDLGDIAAAFFDNIRDLVRAPKEDATEKKFKETEAELRTLYTLFFEHAMQWAAKTRQQYQNTPNHPKAQQLKKKAAEVLSDMQDNMIKYAVGYMSLWYSEGCILKEIPKYERTSESDHKVEWSSESGYMLQKTFVERRQLLETNKSLQKGMEALKAYEGQYQAVMGAAAKLFGDKNVEDEMRSFRAAMRVGDFTKAKKALDKLDKAKTKLGANKEELLSIIKKEGSAFINGLEKAKEDITGSDGKLYLSQAELSVLIGSNEQEIAQKTKYIRKYQHPFMEGKIAKLVYFREKMLIVGSIDGLLTLYMRLIRGLAQPLVEQKDVRSYEEEVLGHVIYLLQGQFQEIDKIEDRRLEEMEDFYATLREFDTVL